MRALAASRARVLSVGHSIHPAVRVGAFAALCAIAAQVKIYVPGVPAPMTLQTFVVALACLCLPWRQATSAMAAYVVLGLAGLPVFADASAGASALTGVTGGYLLGFVLAPIGVALAFRKPPTSFGGAFAAGLMAHGVVFACGVPWLKVMAGSSWTEAVTLGLAPFAAGTLVKSALSASIAFRPSRA